MYFRSEDVGVGDEVPAVTQSAQVRWIGRSDIVSMCVSLIAVFDEWFYKARASGGFRGARAATRCKYPTHGYLHFGYAGGGGLGEAIPRDYGICASPLPALYSKGIAHSVLGLLAGYEPPTVQVPWAVSG